MKFLWNAPLEGDDRREKVGALYVGAYQQPSPATFKATSLTDLKAASSSAETVCNPLNIAIKI